MSNESIQNSTDNIRNTLIFQLDISWQMLELHLTGLEDEECLWKPAPRSLHVADEAGIWRADWPDTEAYDIGPSSIAWLTWHITFWWSMVFDYAFGNGTLTREAINWPGSVTAAREKIIQLHDEWKTKLETLPDEELFSGKRTKWPFEDRPFYELAAWLNLELMKNAAEIGCGRFLYASRKQ
ncbi:MAG TPA: DinB family protein [Clostridia bacterium]|nr:DinB family protein [Clostridia bacterium]